jgi:hypothetical protein
MWDAFIRFHAHLVARLARLPSVMTRTFAQTIFARKMAVLSPQSHVMMAIPSHGIVAM